MTESARCWVRRLTVFFAASAAGFTRQSHPPCSSMVTIMAASWGLMANLVASSEMVMPGALAGVLL
ncbi:MAG: hypothetical protein ACK56I_23110, partial [bacterium]